MTQNLLALAQKATEPSLYLRPDKDHHRACFDAVVQAAQGFFRSRFTEVEWFRQTRIYDATPFICAAFLDYEHEIFRERVDHHVQVTVVL